MGEKSRNILLSQDSDIQEGHILLRIPSQQSLDDKPEVDRKPNRKSDCKQDAKRKRMTLKSELGKLSFVEDEEKSEEQKDQRHDAKSDDRIIDLYSGKHLSSNVSYMKGSPKTVQFSGMKVIFSEFLPTDTVESRA